MNDLHRLTAQYDVTHELMQGAGEIDLAAMGHAILVRWKLILICTVLGAALTFGIASIVPPTFTGKTTLLPPQQQQSSAAAAISQLGALAGIAGGIAGVKSPADQYVALMQSVSVSDQLIDQFNLMNVYESKFRQDARKELANNTRIIIGKTDGLLNVEVDDHDPKRAADMANALVDGLRRVTTTLAVSEAQQRRQFFETQLQQTKDRLTKAQIALESSGFNQGALKAEPKAAAEGYARLRAEVTGAEVRLQTMRRMLTDTAPELLQQQTTVESLRSQLARAERREVAQGGSDYITKYREFKYQETLFDLFARQYELARVDESRDGVLIQVIDPATPPEKRSKPKVLVLTAGAAATIFLLLCSGFAFAAARRTTSMTKQPA